MNVKEIAAKRVGEINYSIARIKRKIKTNPSRKSDYEKRLAEYDISLKALDIELKTGISVRVNDKKQQALIAAVGLANPTPGVTVSPPAGNINMVGK